MSKLQVQGNVSGTGIVTLAAPNTNSNITLTIPAVSAELITNSSGVLNIGSGQVYKDASGNVGIGTATPTAKLHTVGLGAFADDGTTQDTTSYGSLGVTRSASGGATKSYFAMTRAGNFVWSVGVSSDNAFVIGAPNASKEISTERMRIDSSGNLGVGTISAGAKVEILQNNPTTYLNSHLDLISTAGNALLSFHASGASAVCIRHERGSGEQIDAVNGNTTSYIPIRASAFSVQSDYRVKENIVPLVDALERVLTLKPLRFNFIKDSMMWNDGRTVDGFIAHETALVVPEAVTGEKDAVTEDGKPILQGIDQAKLIPLLTAAIQELTARLEALENN
jgi:hypothetical protein